jgi:hypothetical protein
MFSGKTISVARYGVPGAVLGVALAWLAGARGPLVQAQQTGPNGEPLLTHQVPTPRVFHPGVGGMSAIRAATSGESDGTIALVVPSNNGSAQWLYLIDTKNHSFTIYKVDTDNPKDLIKLEAARQYQWDLKLDNYNNSGLKPAEIEKVVKSLIQQTKH